MTTHYTAQQAIIRLDEASTRIGWTGDHEGYHVADYFRDGAYLGTDADGIEPVFPARVTVDEDGVYIAECDGVPGCVSQGPTHAAALDSLRGAIAAVMA